MKPLIKVESAFPVTIFIAGNITKARDIAIAYCNEIGLCVTIKDAMYVYTGGWEHGVEVGLINYPRFPSDPIDILAKATDLANLLREGLDQESFTIQTRHNTIWHSWRKEDVIDGRGL